MPYFYVQRDNGSFLIDDQFPNYRFVRKVSVTTSDGYDAPGGKMWHHATVSLSGIGPDRIVAVKSVSMCVVTTFEFGAGTVLIYTEAPETITVYLFDANPPGDSTYGLQVFNADGNCIFDALERPLRLYSAHAYSPTGSNVPKPSSDFAIAPCTLGQYQQTTYRRQGVTDWWTAVVDNYLPGFFIGAGSTMNLGLISYSMVEIPNAIFDPVPPSAYSDGVAGGSYLVVDVSGL